MWNSPFLSHHFSTPSLCLFVSVLFPSFTRSLTLYSRPVCLFVYLLRCCVYTLLLLTALFYISLDVYVTGQTGQTRLMWDEIIFFCFFLFQYYYILTSGLSCLMDWNPVQDKVSTSDLVTYFYLLSYISY